MIEIDGSTLEGGGQIVRTATALSVITKKDCRIFNIRQSRKKPGLSYQHLLGLQASSRFCDGRLEGDFLGSQEIKFYPGSARNNKILINIPTAGSITLALQSLLLAVVFSLKKEGRAVDIIFDGGATDTFFSPTFDFFQYVFLEILEQIGVKTKINILQRGYYPEGGAKVEVAVSPSQIKGFNLTKRGKLRKILLYSGASKILKDKKVAERQLAGAREILGKLKLPIEEKFAYYQTKCPGSHICLAVLFENTVMGVDSLGKLGKRAEDVGKEAALNLLDEERTKACLDKYSADQILPYLSLASAKSEISVSKITNHAKTNMWVIEKFLSGKFRTNQNLISWH